MILRLFALAVQVCVSLGMSGSAEAQMVRQTDQLSQYGQTRGWTVYRVTNIDSGFTGCRAVKQENGAQIGIELENGAWVLSVPTRQQSRFGGGLYRVDKADFDAQFGFQNGFALKELSSAELNVFKSGRTAGVEVNGDHPVIWSLHGSAAATLKVQECALGSAAASNQQAALPSSRALAARCDAPTASPYPCEVSQKNPAQSYVGAYQVVATHGGQPSYFFQVQSELRSDAWVAFDGGAWTYLGIWEPDPRDPDCAQPAQTQVAEAQQNLGQDAWGLCIR